MLLEIRMLVERLLTDITRSRIARFHVAFEPLRRATWIITTQTGESCFLRYLQVVMSRQMIGKLGFEMEFLVTLGTFHFRFGVLDSHMIFQVLKGTKYCITLWT